MSPAPFQPPSPQPRNMEVPNQQFEAPTGIEGKGELSRSVVRSYTIRKATNTIITTRDELAAYLLQYNIKLLTSSVEFQQSGDFLTSSYVLFEYQGNITESLEAFLKRYPSLVETVEKIRQTLRPIQSIMQVTTPKTNRENME